MRKHRSRRIVLVPAVLLWVMAGPVPGSSDPGTASGRFQASVRWTAGPVDWVTFQEDHGVLGSGAQITIVAGGGPLRVTGRRALPARATGGLLVGSRLFLVGRAEGPDRLAALELDAPESLPKTVDLRPAARGALRLAQMDDYLLVAEDGFGLRVLRLPAHHDHAVGQHAPPQPLSVGALPLDERFTAIAASLRTVYLAVPGGLLLVDASLPRAPRLERRLPLSGAVHALAANGTTLYALGPDGLAIIRLDAGGVSEATAHPEVSGSAIQLTGRTLHVAAGEQGLLSVEDTSTLQATIFIQVGDIFFNPSGVVNVNQGDTVVWQKAGTLASHNVFSCNGVQSGCGGQSATETFTSGSPTSNAFNLSHTFTVAGSNPYVCQVHFTTMQGNIQVQPIAPPGVADGRNATTPMTVAKLDAAGSALRVVYDAGVCGGDADDHNILFGTGTQLPAVLGGTYALGGARCDIGTTSPFDWLVSPPAPASGDFLWWIVVADDGNGTEGSWSSDGVGDERDGAGANGSSNECGNADKDLTNSCPP